MTIQTAKPSINCLFIIVCSVVSFHVTLVASFQLNILLPIAKSQHGFSLEMFSKKMGRKYGDVNLESQLVAAIENKSRLSNDAEIERLVKKLEESTSSIQQPSISQEIMGRWKLLHTNNSGTSSPIQRNAVDASKFQIYQDIGFREDDPSKLIVSQIVNFGSNSELKVDALASTSAFPLPEVKSRKSDGKIFGLNILGVSLIGDDAESNPQKPNSRIDFVFDRGTFYFNGFQIPYPVPFRWSVFKDAAKGWIDITYLSDRIRISRGNKGTTFVLIKEEKWKN